MQSKENSISNKKTFFKDFSNINTNKLSTEASPILNKQETKTTISCNNSIDTKVNYIIENFKQIIDKNVLITKLSKAKLPLKSKPWITMAY